MLTQYKFGWSTISYKDGSLELLKDGKSVFLQGEDSLPLRKSIDSFPYGKLHSRWNSWSLRRF